MKLRKILWVSLLALLLCGCAKEPDPTIPPTEATQPPTMEATQPPTVETVPLTEAPTDPDHWEFFLPELSAEDVITYFSEVCLGAEFVNSGDPSRLQRWEETIYYSIEGEPTEQDVEVIEAMVQWLNTVEGFPGMEASPDPARTNLNIYFCDQEELLQRLGDNFQNTDGGVTFWYQDDIIFKAIVCVRTDLDQELRTSVILEELYNGLGPIQDTALREDSIIWSEFSKPQALTPVDALILRLLYHPSLSCGMDAAECAEAIRQLYH